MPATRASSTSDRTVGSEAAQGDAPHATMTAARATASCATVRLTQQMLRRRRRRGVARGMRGSGYVLPVAAPDRPGPWLYVFASPIVLLNVVALLHDPARLGERSTVSGQPVLGLLGLGLFMGALVGGTWRYSRFRHRTPVALLQLALNLAQLVPFAVSDTVRISWWDVVGDVAWIASTAAQVLGRGRSRLVDGAENDVVTRR